MLIMNFRAFLFNCCLDLATFFLFLAGKLSRRVVPPLRRDQSAEQLHSHLQNEDAGTIPHGNAAMTTILSLDICK
jgi:hypothetical protein